MSFISQPWKFIIFFISYVKKIINDDNFGKIFMAVLIADLLLKLIFVVLGVLGLLVSFLVAAILGIDVRP